MPAYELELRNDKQKAIQRFYWFLFFLQLTAAAMSMAFSAFTELVNRALIFVIIYIIFGLLYFPLRKTKYALQPGNPVLLVVYLAAWYLLGGILPAFIFAGLICFVLYLSAQKNKVIINDNGAFVHGGLTVKSYAWKDIDNVLLKDRLLTIDLKNNHILQNEITENSYAVSEQELNAYCRLKLFSERVN